MTGLASVRGTAGAGARPDRLRCFADQRSDRAVELFEMPQAVAMHRHPLRGGECGAGFRVGDFAQQLDAELEIMTLDVTLREHPHSGIRDLGGLDAFIYIGQTTTEVAEHGDFREIVVGESAREFVPVRRCHDSKLRYGETRGWMQWSPSRMRFPDGHLSADVDMVGLTRFGPAGCPAYGRDVAEISCQWLIRVDR